MYGTSATTFSPDTTMTRGMIVTILYRLEGSPKVSGTAFDDVAADAYYADAATWAVQNEIVNGCGDKTFCPDSPITREQMAAVLYRYAQFKGEDVSALADLSGYADVASVSEYALTAMQWANKAGLITGTSSTTLSPQGSATRAEAAMILYRFCTDVLGENGIHKVVFDLNYNGAGENKTVSITDGQKLTAPEKPSRSGYRFLGWYTQASGGSKFDFNTAITGDMTLYAHWSVASSGGSSSSPEDVMFSGNDPHDVGTLSLPGVTVTTGQDGDTYVVTMSGEVAKDDLAALTDFEALSSEYPADTSYGWAEDVAFMYAYFELPQGANAVDFDGQITVPNTDVFKLDNNTIDGQKVTIGETEYYKMSIQFAHKAKSVDWALSVGANNPDNIVEYNFTVGTMSGDGSYTPLQTYKLKLDYSQLNILTGAKFDNGGPADVAKIEIPGVTVDVTQEGDADVVTMSGEVEKDDLAALTECPTDDSNYSWADDVAFMYAYFELPKGADYANFGDQVSVPSDGLIELNGETVDGQVVEIDGVPYYKMVIQFAHKAKGADWALSVGENNPDNVVNYTFTVGSVSGDTYTPMQTYKLTLDYSHLSIV